MSSEVPISPHDAVAASAPTPTTRAVDPSVAAVSPELTWLAERGLSIRLPGAPRSLVAVGTPVLHILPADAPPPTCGPLEDWIRLPIERDDLIVRADRLLDRARARSPLPVEVVDGVLRAGELVEVLSPQEERLMRALLDQPGQLVPREDLIAATWPDGAPSDPRALDNRVKTLRRRLEAFPLRLHTVRSRGLLVELDPPS